jgi:hypothetical protein
MEGSEFSKYFNHFPFLKNYFVGTFAIDTLPTTLKKDQFLVFNSDTSDKKGQHWLCLYKENKNLLCFDSIGIDSNKTSLLKEYCKFKGIREIHFNETQFQLSTSETCGQFVIYFLIHKAYNKDLTFNELLEDIFCADQAKNEILIQNFFNKIFLDLTL